MAQLAAKRAQPPTIGEVIRQRTGDLTPAERKIARLMFATNLLAGFDTVARLAERAEVSGPTVVRFVSKLGFAGYPEFQRALRDELEARMSSPLALFDRRGEAGRRDDLLARAKKVFVQSLEATFDSIPSREFEAVVDLLADARRTLWTTGGRFSHLLAEMLYAHLYQLRPKVRLLRFDVQSRDDQLLDVGRRDVFVVFDYRRYQKDTIQLAARAAKRRATIVLITDPWLSPVADVADHVLVSDVEAPSPYDSSVAGVALVELLVAAVMPKLGARSLKRIRELEDLRAGFVLEERDNEN